MNRLLLLVALGAGLAACNGDDDTDTDVDTDTDADTDTDPPIEDGCTEVQAVLDANCTGCHGAFAVDGLDLRDITPVVQDWGSLIGMRCVGNTPDRFQHVLVAAHLAPSYVKTIACRVLCELSGGVSIHGIFHT